MARQGINTGSSPDAGDGDALLIGAIKINNNFDEIYTLLGDGTNLSPGIVTSIVAGTNITVSGSTGQVTINASGSGGSSSQWVSTAAGIHTLSSVGIGTTNPTSALTVKGNTSLETLNVSGIATFGGYVSVAGTASFRTGVSKGVEFVNEFGGGTIRISNDGGNSQGRISFNGSVNSTLYSNYTNGDINFVVGNNFSLDLDSYGTYALYATKNGSVSLYNNGSKKFETLGAGVTVTGTTFTNQLSVSGVSTFNNNVRVSGIVTANSVLVSNDGGNNGSVLIEDTGAYSQITFRASNGLNRTLIQGVEANLYITPGSGGYVSLSGPANNVFYGSGDVVLNISSQGTTHAANGLRVTGLTSTTSLIVLGNAGIGTTNPGEKLQVDGNIRVGISTTSNYIAFYGTYKDGPLNVGGELPYQHTYIGERIYDYSGSEAERSELLLFKGNDTTGVAGPDRIRLLAGEHRFDVLGFSTTGTFEQVGLSTAAINKLTITSTGVGIGTTNPLSGYDLTVGAGGINAGIRSTGLKVYGYGNINGLTIKGYSDFYDDNVVISQNPASNPEGGRNINIGAYSFQNPGAAGENVAIGYYALNAVGNDDSFNAYNGNVGVGAFAGQFATTTIRNTFIGYNAGQLITTGSQNSILGAYNGNQNGLDIRTLSNNIVLSDGDGNIRFYANSSGNVGLGTTNPTEKLTVRDGDISVGVSTAHGVILTSPNGTQYRLIVDDSGTLSTVAV